MSLMSKNEIRTLYKYLRKQVLCREEKEKKIADRLCELVKSAKSVFCYESLPGEVSTTDIIARLSEFAEVYVPVVRGNTMLAYSRKNERYATRPCEVTIVPLIAFDENRNRIGFGGGYYDRYLAACDTKSVAIAFDEQQCEPFDTEKTDIRPNVIITPTRILEG